MPTDTRRSFLKTLAVGAIGIPIASRRAAAQAGEPSRRMAAWARLVTPDPQWNRHQEEDPELTAFIRKGGLDISSQCYTVKPSNLAALCAFPLIFTDDLAAVEDPTQINNLREYLYRGGFIYVDGCHDATVTPFFRIFHERHLACFARLLPGFQIRVLSSKHPIFQSLYAVDERELISNPTPRRPQWEGTRRSLYGVFDDDRIVILLSQEGIRCAWGPPWDPREAKLKRRLAANIHAYAIKNSNC